MPSPNSDPAVLVASLLFVRIGTGSIYYIVVALKLIATDFGSHRTVPSIAYALQYAGAGNLAIITSLIARTSRFRPAYA